MRRRRLVVTLLVVGVLLLAAGATLGVATLAGASWLPWSRRVSQWMERPDLNVVPPDSLEDLAAEYPELAQLLGDPELGSVYKEFLVAYQEGGVEAASELAQARGLLTPDGEHLRVTLVLDIDDPAPLAAQLEGVGVEVVTAYKDRINIAVPVALIEQAFESEETGEVFRRLTELEHVIAVRLPDQAGSNQQDKLGEGVGIIGADAWHDAGYRGEGIRVGVLDLGFAGHEDLLGDELPERVAIETFGWFDDEEVHGTACAEIVHEVADAGWSRHAVISFLKRLEQKGAVHIDSQRRPSRYLARLSQDDAQKTETAAVLQRVFGGNLMLMVTNAVDSGKLSDQETQALIDLLKKGG